MVEVRMERSLLSHLHLGQIEKELDTRSCNAEKQEVTLRFKLFNLSHFNEQYM